MAVPENGKAKMDMSGKIVGMPKMEVIANFSKKQMENPANASGNVSKGVLPKNIVDKA